MEQYDVKYFLDDMVRLLQRRGLAAEEVTMLVSPKVANQIAKSEGKAVFPIARWLIDGQEADSGSLTFLPRQKGHNGRV